MLAPAQGSAPTLPSQDDFLHRHVPALGKRVHRLGLAVNFGIDAASVGAALEHGMNFVYLTERNARMVPPLREALARDRERYLVAAPTTIAFFRGNVRRGAERALKRLQTDYLDVLLLSWLGVGAAWTDGTISELVKLKEQGKVRAVGVSIHDRERAGRLAADSPLDLLMIRYNAAHPGAERDIFPPLRPDRPAVLAYTATRWRKLLKRPRGWTGAVPTAGDCYRFCLSHPKVDLVLTGPADAAQLEQNLAEVARGPLDAAQLAWMREFGAVVHG